MKLAQEQIIQMILVSRSDARNRLVQDYRRDQLHAMQHIHWLWSGLAWSIDATEYNNGSQIIPVQDLASRYRFRPLVSDRLDGRQIAANDNFANAQVLSGDVVSATNNNQNATLETGEPTATGYFTLWYAWTAPDTGEATINLNGSASFTQVLTVWMGNSVSGLKAVVSGYPVTFPVVAGTVHHICTGSYYNNQYGNIQINISLNTSSSLDSLTFIGTGTTTNDNFVNRIVTGTEYGSFVAYNGSATREALETTPGYNTMWWTYHAPANGRLDINDVGDGTWTFTKYISVWSGTAVQSLELLTPSVTGGDCDLPVIQGNDYQVCVSSYYNNQNGPIVLTFSLNTSSDLNSFNLSGGATFTNDNFNSATVLTGATPAVIAYNTYATREALEATPGYNTVWFKWTAPASGSTQILTQGSDSFTKYLTIYTGTAINALTQVVQPAAAAAPTASFTAIAGQTYYICVGSYYNNHEQLIRQHRSKGSDQHPDVPIALCEPVHENAGTH